VSSALDYFVLLCLLLKSFLGDLTHYLGSILPGLASFPINRIAELTALFRAAAFACPRRVAAPRYARPHVPAAATKEDGRPPSLRSVMPPACGITRVQGSVDYGRHEEPTRAALRRHCGPLDGSLNLGSQGVCQRAARERQAARLFPRPLPPCSGIV